MSSKLNLDVGMNGPALFVPTTLQEGVNTFLIFHAGRLAESYQEWLGRRLKSLLEYLTPDMPLADIQISHLDGWYNALSTRGHLYANHKYRDKIEGRGLAPDTLHGYVRAVKTLFNWLGKRRYITVNPASLLGLPPLPEPPPKAPSQEDIKKLLDYVKSHSLRNYVAIRLLQSTGIRACGFQGLTLQTVNITDRWVLVREKGRGGKNKSRYVPFDPITADALAHYLNERPTGSGNAFFISDRNEPLTSEALRLSIRRYCKTLDIPNINIHMLRHFFGLQCAQRDLHLREIQQLMGHTDSKTTERYVQFNPQQLKKAYDKAYPSSDDIESDDCVMA